MTGKFSVEGGKLTITNGSRVVSTTDGTLVCLQQTLHAFNDKVMNFPDFTKDEAYVWTYSGKDVPLSDPDTHQFGESCTCFITALPQEYSTSTTLMAAPAGADFFIGQMRVARSTAPLSTWMGRSLVVLPIENQWLPVNGALSVLLEAEINMCRALHLYINNARNLVLEVEQSVGPAMGGYGNFSHGAVSIGSSGDGGSILQKTTKGTPILLRSAKAYGYTDPTTSFLTPQKYARDGVSPCARSDNTEYKSVYSVDVQGVFGRRS